MPVPPLSQQRYLSLKGDAKSSIEAEMPFRVGGISARPIPIAIQCETHEKAMFLLTRLRSFVNKYHAADNTTIASHLAGTAAWKPLCAYMDRGASKYVVDVRLGGKSGVYCTPLEAFQSLGRVKPRFQRAFIFSNFGAALISSIKGGDCPTDMLWDYNPSEHPAYARQIKQHVLNPTTRPPSDPTAKPQPPSNPTTQPSSDPPAAQSSSDPPAAHSSLDPPPQSSSVPTTQPSSGLNHAEDWAAIIEAMDIQDPIVAMYLNVVGVPQAAYNNIDLMFETSNGVDEFVSGMTSAYKEWDDAWKVLYALFQRAT
ncbi:hypothetical protein VNI00_016897 [Paramarasmius palmivorus]|uniref:Uncharacterized protein n=1 Tax=Paramarasmius palmivorus TaxID=297713 RepID=A0AAW0B9W6_9AGAR